MLPVFSQQTNDTNSIAYQAVK